MSFVEISGKSFGRKEHAWPSSSEGASWEKRKHIYIYINCFSLKALNCCFHDYLTLMLFAEISGDPRCWSQEVVKWERRKLACIAFNLAICMCYCSEDTVHMLLARPFNPNFSLHTDEIVSIGCLILIPDAPNSFLSILVISVWDLFHYLLLIPSDIMNNLKLYIYGSFSDFSTLSDPRAW